MHRLLTRLLAVLALAAAPLVGVGSVSAQSEHWPVYPSLYYSYSTCNVANNYVVCQPGGIMESQINSGYQCNEIDVVMTTYNAGPVDITMSANDQSVTQTMTIDGDGTYYTQFPGYLVNNLVALEFSMPDGASFGLPTIYSTPCPVATSTPTAAPSNTPNPSFTATPTVNPSYTVTPIPTYTPLPSGHSTFTATVTATPTATATKSPTPGPTAVPCGGGFVNCNFEQAVNWGGGYSNVGAGPPWHYDGPVIDNPLFGADFAAYNQCQDGGSECGTYPVLLNSVAVDQYITVASNGYFCVSGQGWEGGGSSLYVGFVSGTQGVTSPASGTWYYAGTGAGYFSFTNAGCSATVAAGSSLGLFYGDESNTGWLGRITVSFYPSGPTSTPTNTPISSPTSSPTFGPTSTPTNTPLPNPFGSSTPVPSDTECPGGCAVTELTQVPGVQTQITVDTSPFSPLLHLSLARSPCTPFGYVQIPYPVITGTPALGQPLNFGWTAPITHTWDDTHLITNTAIQPCAMVGEISPYVWDFTYWGSGVGLAIVFTLWLIGWVGRLSGDHTIDG